MKIFKILRSKLKEIPDLNSLTKEFEYYKSHNEYYDL